MSDIFRDDLVVETEPEIAPATSLMFGVVANCAKLNIRKVPNQNAEIITVVPVNTELMIDIANSTNEWYSVCTVGGIEGFCMKQYITILQ